MPLIGKSNFGKLFIGGCGTQIGLLLTVGAGVVALLFCAICASSSALSVSLTQELTANQSPTIAPVETSSSSAEVEILRQEVDLLREKVVYLRVNVPTVQLPTATSLPPPPKPFVTANQGAVNLRSGPGLVYSRIGRLLLGESLEIVGRNSDSSWWLVSAPGGLAWLCGDVAAAHNVDDSIPIVTIPALLVQPVSSRLPVLPSTGVVPVSMVAPAASIEPTPVLPPGTPTAAADQSRRFVQDTTGYKQLVRRLLLPTVSESFSPYGDQIAITEKITLYTIAPDGSSSRVLLEDDETIDLVGNAVWSPDGQHIAFVADRLDDCSLCRIVGLVRLSDGSITFLKPPIGSAMDMPRWTQDGRLLVIVYWNEPAQGAAYIYDTSGQGRLAEGSYVLSSSHDGQKWFPWQPGKSWQVDNSEGAGSYYSD